MSNHYDTKNGSIIRLIARGQFTDIERLCINNPTLRSVLLHWRGVRDTAFFKNRLRFYKNFAKKTGLRKFTPEVKNQMRDEFARHHCLSSTLKIAYDTIVASQKTKQDQNCDLMWFLKSRRKGRWGMFK